jgi:tetratricopeptide (TPR) repeat protein
MYYIIIARAAWYAIERLNKRQASLARHEIAMIYNNRGIGKKYKKDLAGAMADYNKAIEIDPTLADAYFNRGLINSKKGDLDGYVADNIKVIELNPNYKYAHNNLGVAKMRKGNLVDAIEAFTKEIELYPKDPLAYRNRGLASHKKGDFDAAIVDYNKAIQLNPKNAKCYISRGNTKRKKGDVSGAIADYNKAIELDPKLEKAYINRANAKVDKGDFNGAIKDISVLLKTHPNSSAYLRQFGLLLFDSGKTEESLKYFLKAINIPDIKKEEQVFNLFYVCIIHARQGKYNVVKKKAGEYLVKFKNDKWPKPIIRFFTGEIKEADLLAASESENPKTAREQKCEAYFYAGEMRLAKGDKEGARDFFKKTLDTDVNNYIEYRSAKYELERIKR